MPLSPSRPFSLALALVACLSSAQADEIASLPLGPMPRALALVSGEAGQFLELAAHAAEGGPARSFDDMIASLATADVVILGEHHAQQAVHDVQARIVTALAQRREIALGMEFFETEDDAALARYVAGTTDTDTMLEETGWYAAGSFNFAYYRPLVDACRERRAPVIGLNVPRAVVRTVSRQGWDALDDAQKALVGEIGEPDPHHRFMVDAMMGGMASASPKMFDGMLRGQMTWDAAMTRSILRARDGVAKGRLVIIVVGMGHAAHGLGIPARLRAADPALRVAVLCPATAATPDPMAQAHPGMEPSATAVMSAGFADWALVVPAAQGADAWPTFGLGLEVMEGEPRVRLTSVEEGSVGGRAGLRKGDVLLAIAGTPAPGTVSLVKAALARLAWGVRAEFTVRRGDAQMVVPVLVVAPADAPGRRLESTRASHLLDAFDPRSPRSLAEASPADGMPQARLVRAGRSLARFDILDGAALAQSWTLDVNGRPVTGLLARPEPDGAVRVELDRGDDGKVVAERRFDAAGQLIVPAVPGEASRVPASAGW